MTRLLCISRGVDNDRVGLKMLGGKRVGGRLDMIHAPMTTRDRRNRGRTVPSLLESGGAQEGKGAQEMAEYLHEAAGAHHQ